MFAASKTTSPSGGVPDPQFNYVTMLLHGDGTNGAQNNTFLDSSTNNFTITRFGNTTQGSFSPYGSNWSNYFDGVSDYLTIPTGTALNLNTGDFTIEGWIYPISTAGYFTLFSNGDYPSTAQIIFLVDGTNNLNLYMSNGTVFTVALASSITINLNTWTHIAATASGTTYTVWVNGVSGGSTTNGFTRISPNSTSLIGRLYPSTNNYYTKGYISNVRVVKGTALYTTTFTPSTTPLTAVSGTSLLTCQSNRFIDNSTNALVITPNGTPSVQRFNPFGASTAYSTSVIGGSGYFDGSGDNLRAPSNSAFTFGTGDYTIEAWVYARDSANNVIVEAGAFFGLYTGFLAYYESNGGLITSSIPVSLNTWTHVALSRSSGTLKLFVNGAVGASASVTTDFTSTSCAISYGAIYGGPSFNGYISNVRVVKGTAVYTSAFTPSTAPLTAISGTSLLTSMTNGAIFDNAMMNNLETVGNAQISTSVVKYGTGSVYVNGSGNYAQSNSCYGGTGLGNSSFTIECWVNTTNTYAFDGIFQIDGGSSSQYSGILVSLSGVFASYTGSGWDLFQSPSLSGVNDGNWHHVALVRNGTSLTLYKDGTATGSAVTIGTNSIYAVNPGRAWVGQQATAGSLVGYIDDFRITKGYARYTANFTPPTAALSNTGPI